MSKLHRYAHIRRIKQEEEASKRAYDERDRKEYYRRIRRLPPFVVLSILQGMYAVQEHPGYIKLIMELYGRSGSATFKTRKELQFYIENVKKIHGKDSLK